MPATKRQIAAFIRMRNETLSGAVHIEIPPEKMREIEMLLADIPNGVSKAVARASNKALERARVEAMRGIKERYTIKGSDLEMRIRVTKATAQNPTATVVWSSPRIPVTKFKVKPFKPDSQSGIPWRLRRAVESEIVKGRKSVWPYAFLAITDSGHRGLFSREEKHSLPIKQKHSVSVSNMIGQQGVLRRITDATNAVIVEELEKQVTRMLSVRRRT